MRIALLSDIHGNAVALQQVLTDIDSGNVDYVVCLGDVVTLGPSPNEVIAMLKNIPCEYIIGNHDGFIQDINLVKEYTDAPIITESLQWAIDKLSTSERAFFKQFKHHILLSHGGYDIYLGHGSPRSCFEDILDDLSNDQLEAALAGTEADIYVFGHTHIQMFKQFKGRLIINPGSVGAPFKEYVGGSGNVPTLMPYVEYAILNIEEGKVNTELKRLELDIKQFRIAIDATDHPLKTSWLKQYTI